MITNRQFNGFLEAVKHYRSTSVPDTGLAMLRIYCEGAVELGGVTDDIIKQFVLAHVNQWHNTVIGVCWKEMFDNPDKPLKDVFNVFVVED